MYRSINLRSPAISSPASPPTTSVRGRGRPRIVPRGNDVGLRPVARPGDPLLQNLHVLRGEDRVSEVPRPVQDVCATTALTLGRFCGGRAVCGGIHRASNSPEQ